MTNTTMTKALETKKSIKIMDGLKVITSDGVKRINGMKSLWKYMGWDLSDKMTDQCATEITRNLICFGRVDLTEFTNPRSTFIIEVISTYNYLVQYREIGEKRWKNLSETEYRQEEAEEEVKRLTETTDRPLEFRVKRIF